MINQPCSPQDYYCYIEADYSAVQDRERLSVVGMRNLDPSASTVLIPRAKMLVLTSAALSVHALLVSCMDIHCADEMFEVPRYYKVGHHQINCAERAGQTRE